MVEGGEEGREYTEEGAIILMLNIRVLYLCDWMGTAKVMFGTSWYSILSLATDQTQKYNVCLSTLLAYPN